MWLILFLILCAGLGAFIFLANQRNMLQWLPAYISQAGIRKNKGNNETTHIMFCFVDHYEPQWKNPDNIELERQRVDRWFDQYPKMAEKFKDADGCSPKHSFFYPEEEYREEHLAKLSDMCYRGFGEIEIHLHHENDTSENLTQSLTNFAKTLHEEHGALPICPDSGQIKYAFIHGNWCLDNSHPNGEWCGVNDELIVLNKTGCYADLTFPSAPSPTQPSTINSIYYVKDDPIKPKSHNKGKDVRVGGKAWGDLMLINGPLMLNWKQRKLGFMPRVENADIRTSNPPSKERVDLWVNANVHVKGQPNWRFIKIHTHGTQDKDMDILLGKPVEDMHQYLDEMYNDGENYKLHYVSAREAYNIVKAAEAGEVGDPNTYRDYILSKPLFASAKKAE
jgi:hypothetical protein